MPTRSSTILQNPKNEKEYTYNVECILDKKLENGEWKYLIKWVGWPKSQSTWEPIENLENVQEMVDEFNEKWPQGKPQEDKQRAKRGDIKVIKNKPKAKAESKSSSSRQCKGSSSTPEKSPKKDDNNSTENTLSKSIESSSSLLENSANHGNSCKNKKVSCSSRSTLPSSGIKKIKPNEPLPSSLPHETKCLIIGNGNNLDLPIHGHFKFGDRAKKIISARIQDNYIICLIEWEPRLDGTLPLRTNLTNKEIKMHDPMILLEFYESRLKFNTNPNVNFSNNGGINAGMNCVSGNNDENNTMNGIDQCNILGSTQRSIENYGACGDNAIINHEVDIEQNGDGEDGDKEVCVESNVEISGENNHKRIEIVKVRRDEDDNNGKMMIDDNNNNKKKEMQEKNNEGYQLEKHNERNLKDDIDKMSRQVVHHDKINQQEQEVGIRQDKLNKKNQQDEPDKSNHQIENNNKDRLFHSNGGNQQIYHKEKDQQVQNNKGNNQVIYHKEGKKNEVDEEEEVDQCNKSGDIDNSNEEIGDVDLIINVDNLELNNKEMVKLIKHQSFSKPSIATS